LDKFGDFVASTATIIALLYISKIQRLYKKLFVLLVDHVNQLKLELILVLNFYNVHTLKQTN
jgi:hypothetical protein